MGRAALQDSVGKVAVSKPLRFKGAILGTAALVMVALPGEGFAQGKAVPDYLKPQVIIKACKHPNGKPKDIYGCVSTGPVTPTTMGEAGKIITDREKFMRCQYGVRRIEGDYNGPRVVGWGSLVESDARKKAGNCPSGEALQAWFTEDLNASYQRALAQAATMKVSNACIVRSLTTMNHQLGDVARKYPDTWKKLQAGQLCNVMQTVLTWSWYQQTCERTLDTAMALDSVKECKVGDN